MLRIGLRQLFARKARLIGTSVAIVLGVAFLSGTLVLGETLESNFGRLLAEANADTDVVVRSAIDVEPDEAGGGRGLIDAELLALVRSLDGVARAEPSIEGRAQLVGKDGSVVGGDGPPTIGGNWIDDPALSPFRLAEGRPPAAPDEVVVNRGAADQGDLAIGDRVRVNTPEPVEVTIVGLATFGDADGLGPTTFTGFTTEAAQRLLMPSADKISTVQVQGEPGVDADELATRIAAQLPASAEAVTGEALSDEALDQLGTDFLDFLRTFLLVFAAVALLVATVSISNTFSIIVAQRTRDSALLRAIGATRGQIATSVLAEVLLVGIAASAIGVVAGLGIAQLLKTVFDAFGFSLPAGGLAITARDVALALTTGVVVTVVAGLAPALRATRVAPLAALRESATEGPRALRRRGFAGASLLAPALVLLAAGAARTDLGLVGLGALALLAGAVVGAPLVVRLVATGLGTPLRAVRGVTGALAVQNAERNPRRTARSATALLVGVGVVTLFTVFAASLKTSAEAQLRDTITAPIVVSTGQFDGGLSPTLAAQVQSLPEVEVALGLGRASALVVGEPSRMSVVEPADIERVLDLGPIEGSLAELAPNELAVARTEALDRGWEVGDAIPLTFSDGTSRDLTIAALFEGQEVTGNYLMSREGWEPHTVQDLDSIVVVRNSPGTSIDDARHAIETVTASHGNPNVADLDGYIEEATAFVDMALGIVYVMLALAIVIALMGIGTTLSLAIHERVRELGLLRAVGQTRRQARSMVRWESVIVSTLGSGLGLVVGLVLGWALVTAASTETFATEFSAPAGQLATIIVLGGAAGVLAAVRPARRASRVDILDAVTTE
jgi:putative ABC transport system permease protein